MILAGSGHQQRRSEDEAPLSSSKFENIRVVTGNGNGPVSTGLTVVGERRRSYVSALEASSFRV